MICRIAERRAEEWVNSLIEDFVDGTLQHGDVVASGSFPVLKSVDRKLWDTIQHAYQHYIKTGICREELFAEEEFWKVADEKLWSIFCTVDSHEGDPCLLVFHDSNHFGESHFLDAVGLHC